MLEQSTFSRLKDTSDVNSAHARHKLKQHFFFFQTGCPCSPSCPGTHYVELAGLELTEIHLLLPPEGYIWLLSFLNRAIVPIKSLILAGS